MSAFLKRSHRVIVLGGVRYVERRKVVNDNGYARTVGVLLIGRIEQFPLKARNDDGFYCRCDAVRGIKVLERLDEECDELFAVCFHLDLEDGFRLCKRIVDGIADDCVH